MANQAVGIDFGHAGIKLVEVRRGRQPIIKRAVYIPVPPGAISRGVIQQPQVLEELLDNFAPAMRLDRVMVVAGAAGAQINVLPVRIPSAEEADLHPLIMHEFTSALHIQPEKAELYHIDYLELPSGSPSEHELLVVGMQKLHLGVYAEVLRNSRLPAYVFEVQAFALPRSQPREGLACYLDIGAEYTQVLVVDSGTFVLYRLLPIGMRRWCETVARVYQVSDEAVERLQREKHIDQLMLEAPGERSQLQKVIEDLLGGIIQTLEFLRARHRVVSIGDLITTIFLSGGGTMQKGMDILLSEEIGIPVVISQPFSFCLGSEKLPPEILDIAPLFTGAMGMALRGLSEP
ncbi:MAG TPA: pilus assembly protein PilM [Firmicutes bacterium]|nr:pilus assembly protein PilM [Bacillota bacterium]